MKHTMHAKMQELSTQTNNFRDIFVEHISVLILVTTADLVKD
jgi:hypothetical protein